MALVTGLSRDTYVAENVTANGERSTSLSGAEVVTWAKKLSLAELQPVSVATGVYNVFAARQKMADHLRNLGVRAGTIVVLSQQIASAIARRTSIIRLPGRRILDHGSMAVCCGVQFSSRHFCRRSCCACSSEKSRLRRGLVSDLTDGVARVVDRSLGAADRGPQHCVHSFAPCTSRGVVASSAGASRCF